MARGRHRRDEAAWPSLQGLAIRFAVDVLARIVQELERRILARELSDRIRRQIVAIEQRNCDGRVLRKINGVKGLQRPGSKNRANRFHQVPLQSFDSGDPHQSIAFAPWN